MTIRLSNLILLALALTISQTGFANNSQQDHSKKPKRPCFSSIDTNEDGQINFTEFSNHKIPHGDHQQVFSLIDTNNNGEISKQEFNDHKPPRQKKRANQENNN